MTEVYRFGAFELRPRERVVSRDGQDIAVGPRAFDLLIALIERPHRLVTKSELLDAVWVGRVVEEANVQVQVSSLRKLLGPDVIATVPGRGYRFTAILRDDPALAAGRSTARAQGAAPHRSTNLPAALDALIGREAELAELVEWVRRHRLVALVGPGGIGKTRLAQAAGRHLVETFADGAWWVDLAALDSAGHIVVSLANAARVQIGGEPAYALEQLLLALESRTSLIVLDNCEHLMDAVLVLVQALQARAPGIRVLVTSQESVAERSCMTFRLGPLAIPAHGSRFEEARSAGALRLFETRARAVDHRFELTPLNLPAAIDIATALDGNPLAIEMAAARAPVLGLDMLRTLLDERFHLLQQTARTTLARHQTLRATLEWSHSLLSDPERTALRRLSAFVGSFRVDVAQHALADEDIDDWQALDALTGLVDKSLVQRESIEPPRYRLLDTVRLFEVDQCVRAGDGEDIARRHGQAMAALAEEVEASYWELPDETWLLRHAADYDDLRAAFERACARGDAEVAAIVGIALTRLDHLRNVNAPRRRRATALHGLLPKASPRARAWIWSSIASHNLIAVEVVSRVEAAQEAVRAWRLEGDVMRTHFALGFHASETARVGDFDTARRLLREADELVEPGWPLRRRMWGYAARAGVCIHQGDAAGYREAARHELDLAERAGAVRAAAWARLKLADAALMAGRSEEAVILGEAAVIELRRIQQPSNLGLALSNLCAALLQCEAWARAHAAAVEALPLMCRNGWGYMLLDSIALIAAREGQVGCAMKLLGYVERWYDLHGDSRQPNEAALALRTRGLCAATLDEAAGAALVEAGAALSDGEAEALAAAALGLVHDVSPGPCRMEPGAPPRGVRGRQA